MFNLTAIYTDQYQLSMAQVYFLKGHKDDVAVFDYFFRTLPFKGGYGIFAGLEDLLNILENLHFDEKDIEFFCKTNWHPDFINYLKEFRFTGTIHAAKEGDLVFPIRPILTVEAPIIEAQLIESLLLNLLNFETLIATKASRMRQVAKDKQLVDFGLRRAQGLGSYHASRAAIIGGFDATSHVLVGRDYNIPVVGTMAHSFIQSYDDELTAFRDFANCHPDNCILLVDTYDTIKSGVPNSIKVAKEMEACGKQLKGIRLDSGDLSYLSKESRKLLDHAGLPYVKIAVSNQLDEYIIKSLLDQNAPIDIFGVGSKLVIGEPDGALDGVYKLALSNQKPRIKLSESINKITLPHKKQVYRILNNKGMFVGDVVTLDNEKQITTMHHPVERLTSFSIKGYQTEALLNKVMEKGKRLYDPRKSSEIAKYSAERLSLLAEEYKRFDNPHIYKVGFSDKLNSKRKELIQKYRPL